MLTAFIDDSDMGGDGPVAVLAGWVAETAVWAQFVDDWKAKVLEIPGAPTLREFKPNAASLRGDTERQRLQAALGLIGKHNLLGVVSMLPHAEYARVFAGPIFTSVVRHPYCASLLNVVYMLASHFASEGGTAGPINFAFDTQPGQMRTIADTWSLISSVPDPNVGQWLGKITFGNPRDDIALQAAHIAAWYFRRKALSSSAKGAPAVEMPWPDNIKIIRRFLSKEDTQSLAQQILRNAGAY